MGVTLDSKGKCQSHTTYAANKGKQVIGAAYRLLRNNIVTIKNKSLIFKSLIRSRYAHASAIWAKHRRNIKTIEVMERKAFRLMYGAGDDRIAKRYVSNKMLYEMAAVERFGAYRKKCK